MKRICPNCNEPAVSIILVMLWSARCKNCNAKVGIDQFKGQLINIMVGMVLLTLVYVFWGEYGLFAVVAAFAVHIIVLVMVEMFGPLVVREEPEGDCNK